MPSNLEIINSKFQSHCWQLICDSPLQSFIICDFPSQIQNPKSIFKIFGLDDFAHFLSSISSATGANIYVITQQFSLLAKLFNPSHSITTPFYLFTRTNFSISMEIKFIELHNALPPSAWKKASNIHSLTDFQISLRGKKGPIPKQFDVFQLYISPSSESSELSAPIMNSPVTGIFHTTDFENITLISQNLASIAIPYSNTNDLQAQVEPLSHVCTLHFEAPSERNLASHLLEQVQQTISSSSHFLLCAITAGLHNLPQLCALSFIPKKKIDISTILPLFSKYEIPHISLSVGLIFSADLTVIEELILAAPHDNIVIPANFLSSILTLSFSHNCEALVASISPFTTPRFTNLQIVRLTPGCPSHSYFTPEFLTLLKSRFYSQGGAQLQTIKDSTGDILEVLAFTSNAKLHTNPPDLELPIPFEINNQKFLVTHLEPSFSIKPKAIFDYPYETCQEHFSRFENVADNLASRIPLIYPHPDKGGPISDSIISSIISGVLTSELIPLSYLTYSGSPSFHILISPFPSDWQVTITQLFTKNPQIIACPLHNLSLHSPDYIILDLPPRTEFTIPLFLPLSTEFSKCGWIAVRSFSNIKIILQVTSPIHSKCIFKFLTSLELPTANNSHIIVLDDPPTDSQPPPEQSSDLLQLNDEPLMDSPAEEELPPPSQPPPFHPPPHALSLIACYRFLSYLTWITDHDHPRQRLLEAVAGGLHLQNIQLIGPYLAAALDSYEENFFTSTLPLPMLQLIANDFHSSTANTLFSSTRDESSSLTLSSIIPLPNLPTITNLQEAQNAFANIFQYLPAHTTLQLNSTTLMFSSQQLLSTSLTHLLPALGSSFTISSNAKLRTSDFNRNIVLKLRAIYVEISRQTLSSSDSLYLFLEQHHPDSNTVTVYDPSAGTQIKQISSLTCFKPTVLIFKRGSQQSLICPHLLRRFAAASPSLPPAASLSPYCIISLFDGSGSFTDVIAKAVGKWPIAILAAEMDAGTRSVVSKVKGWSVEGSVWTYDKHNAHTFYAENVWSIIDQHCLLLRQLLSLLPPDCVIFFGAGSPCPDLTIIGRGNGVLGLTGNRSVHIHCVWAVLYFLSKSRFWKRVVFLVENAGSMKPHMKQYIHKLLGIPEQCAHYLNCAKWGSVSRARYFFTASSTVVTPLPAPSPFDEGWSPALIIEPDSPNHLKPRPLPPWLRPRLVTERGSVVQSPLAYHPKNLLYDISFFGKEPELQLRKFQESLAQNLPSLFPILPFKNFLPEFLWSDWDHLIAWGATFDSSMTPAIISAVSNLQDFYDNPFIYTPFRLPTLNEKATDSELSDLLSSTITEANPPIKTLHNIIGNFFKPSAVCAALGGTDNIKNYVYGDLKPSEWAPLAPPAVDLLFSELKRKVTTDTIEQPDLRPFMAERWYPKKSPNLERDDFWHTALHTPSSPVFTAPTPPPPMVPDAVSPNIILPYSQAILHTLSTHSILNQLAHGALVQTYPTSVLFTNPFPPFTTHANPFLLSPPLLLKLPFLIAYFKGWESFQSSNAAIVLREESGVVTHYAFGSLDNFYRLYLFIFDSLQESFQFSLLIQGIEPPVELLTILHGMHASWSLPEDILSYKYLLAQFPTLIVFTNDNVTQLSSLSLYPPWESSFYPISLTIPSLLPLLYSLFEPSEDAPMWGSCSLPTFSGSYPFQVHLQLWLFVHSSFLEHYGFPATPFIFINCTSSVETITEPDLFICAKDSPPTVELLLQTKCPHFFMHDHHTDQTAPHYGLVIATPASMYSDIMVSDLSPQFIPYP